MLWVRKVIHETDVTLPGGHMRANRRLGLTSRREFLCAGTAIAAATLTIGLGESASAQAAIETLHVLCGAPAGSAPDIVARHVAEQLAGRYAKNTIVENRPGAAGRIAVNALKQAPADGSTLLLAAVSVVSLNPLLYEKLDYDPEDVRPVSMAAEMPLALAVGPAVPQSVGNVRELVEWMRSNPALANVGSPGVGSLPHLLEAMFFRQADVAWTHVPFQGGPPAVSALLGAQIAAVILPEAILGPQRAAGKLRVLATSGAQRSLHMPDVPSFVEQGYHDLVVLERFALFMSGRVSPKTIETASQSIRQAVAQPELARAFATLGMVAVASTPAELAANIAAEKRSWEGVVRATGIVIK
jgi:tripartite-type tricarboxylate transporter receptor subunit TctC